MNPLKRDPALLGVVGLAVAAALTLLGLNYDRIPLLDQKSTYVAEFADASGLRTGAAVQVSGLPTGEVTDVRLVDSRVVVHFTVDDDIFLGDRTEAAVKARSVLGAKMLEITPRGDSALSAPIPTSRTTPAYQLPDALGDLAETVSGLDTDGLEQSLRTLAQTFRDTPADLQLAVEGVSRFSRSINERDDELRALLVDANRVTGILARNSDRVTTLVGDTTVLLAELQAHSAALDQLSATVSRVSGQLTALVAENRDTMPEAVAKLNGVLTIVDNRKERIQESITMLNQYTMSLGEAVSSGPFFNAYVANLLPGQFVQPFIESAFSDLGLDPNVLLPSELTDPQTGQSGTPALPVPFPRTGQGGEPHLTLPDAITGNPGDPRYPYREPLPAPAPGGPPPGPPAVIEEVGP
ncbi:MAG: MCE family protein [Actinomycetota bacterium]|nr:MCE family protein [Actinomycetota bacterium]